MRAVQPLIEAQALRKAADDMANGAPDNWVAASISDALRDRAARIESGDL